MAHRTRIRPNLAAWAIASAVLNTEYEALDAAQYSAIDGDAGGIWLPSGKIIIGGTAGLEMSAPLRVLGSFFPASLIAGNWPERVAFANTTAADTNVALAYVPSMGALASPLYVLLETSKKIYISRDGTSWVAGVTLANGSTARPELASGQLDGAPILLSNGGVLGHFYTSPDGSTWTDRDIGSLSTVGIPAYASSLNRWVFVGSSDISYATGTTAGFAAWAAATVPGAWASNSGGVKRLLWSGSMFVALPIGVYNKCLTSPDGITWTERSLASTQLWTGLAYSATEGLWLAISDGGHVSTSPDGITWTPIGATAVSPANDLAVNGPVWVIATRNGAYGGIAFSVDNGVTWKPVPVGKHSVATAGWKRLIFGDRFLAAHLDGTNIEVALSLRSI